MQKIIKGLLIGLSVLSIASCTKTDNYPGPNAGFMGNVKDKTDPKGANLLTETNGFQIKLEELSWSATPAPQTIPAKPDGTFEDTQLFSGHYRVTPIGGAFWPVAPIEMDINKGNNNSRDFQVTPYMKIYNFTATLDGTTLVMHFQLDAPITEGLPNILDVQPFVNITPYVGSGATVPDYTNNNKLSINAPWSNDMATKVYEIRVPNMKSGRQFYVRAGVRVDDSYKAFNYSEIVPVQVP
ncbi:DUF3823 domain-containing protein [Chitinophaga sp. 30R24]|uniref:DUF3823 domain-containing protein n=1 Tax=Chitinophaga sp. 30R24 TaxID=3248838 RepID=UPI003B8FA711